MKPKDLRPKEAPLETPTTLPHPDAAESPADALLIDERTAGEIARHWYERENWPRLAAIFADRAMLTAILHHHGCCQSNVWWNAMERATGMPMEASLESAWRHWSPDESLEETGDFAMELVELLSCAGRCGPFTERLVRLSMGIDASIYGEESGILAFHLESLAGIHLRRGDLVVAEQMALRALAITEKTEVGGGHLTAARWSTLARVYMSQERYDCAASAYRHALALHRQLAVVDDRGRAHTGAMLANALAMSGQAASAEPIARRAVADAETCEEADRGLVANNLRILAEVLEALGKWDEIEPMRRRALAFSDARLGPDHWVTRADLAGLTRALLHARRFQEAEDLLERALAAAERNVDADGSNLFEALVGFSELYFRQDRPEAAEPLLERMVGLREEIPGADPAGFLYGLRHLARLCRKRGLYPEAEAHLQRANQLFEEGGCQDPSEMARVFEEFAYLRTQQGRVEEAELAFERCIELYKAVVPPATAALARVEQERASLLALRAEDSDLDCVPL